MNRLLVVVPVLLPLMVGAQEPSVDPARPITLDEAVAMAQRNAPAAVQARGQIRNAGAGVSAAYSAFIPSFTVNASRSYQGGQASRVENGQVIEAENPWSTNMGLQAQLDLFDGGQRLFDLRAARATANAAEANDIAQRFGVAFQVKQAFYNALAARESESAAQSQREQAEQQLRAASARVAAGAATKSDSLRSVIQVGDAQLALLTSRNNLVSANATLTRLIGAPEPVTADPSDTLDVAQFAADSASMLELAMEGPAVAQAEANFTASRAASRAARTPYLPTIGVSFNRSANGPDLEFGFGEPFRYTTSWRFSLNYPIFNQFTREANRVRADVAEENARAALRDARLAAQEELVQVIGALRTAQQRVTIQTVSVAAAEEDLRVQQQRYAVGASTLLDVLTSQTQLNQARAALISARYDYRVAKAQLEALVGREL
ncbi:MAG TPA: TolC family protein [Gemmatimonadaceae bacterium]|nr:TolC family protein [Gemmatimonadaceae bacterium]